VWQLPAGPGVRVDTGFEAGDVIGGNFDSLLAKLIVTGKDRNEAIERSRRALSEFNVEGIATALTFHRVVVSDPAFAPADPAEPFTVHTRWIETEFDNQIPAYIAAGTDIDEPAERNKVVVEVNGKRLEVSLPGEFGMTSNSQTAVPTAKKRERKKAAAASGDSVSAPMQGTIVKVEVTEGQEVQAGELIVVLEAMKMEQPLTAHKAGTITGLNAEVGTTVPAGTSLCEIK
jgi:acetyl-CoA/propionyl-CoA carboxylase, biotin carboxylase, biotin carboxyl carrier protein